MAKGNELGRLIDLAQQLEYSGEAQARREVVERRLQMYYGRWNVQKQEGLNYVLDTMPRVVGDRAQDKLCAQPYTLTVRSDVSQLTVLDPMMAPDEIKAQNQDIAKAARDLADRKEAQLRGMSRLMEAQRGIDILRGLAYSASVCGFAGPLRLGFDESALAEKALPLHVQLLDPRSFLYMPDGGAGRGPRLVIYKRRAKRQILEYEGWDLTNNPKIDRIDPDTEVTIYDCWEKERTSKGLKLWHSIILDGGEITRDFLKERVDLYKLKGLSRIPYVFRAVRPGSFADDLYPYSGSAGFLDILSPNWEFRCKLLSWQAQMVQLNVDPPTAVFSRQPTEVDVITPGAQHQMDPGDNIEILTNPQARPEIGQAQQILDIQTQRGTFAATSFGEGSNQMSGLMTGRLQQSSEEALGSTRAALESAIADYFNLIAIFANVYLKGNNIVVPLRGTEAGLLDPEIFNGTEVMEVSIPGMTVMEQMQQGANARALSEPRSDGSKWASDETTRRMSGAFPYEAQETQAILRESWKVIELERVKRMQLEKEVQREEEIKDLKHKMQMQQQMMAAQQQQQGQPLAVDPAQAQQPEGVAASPLAESMPEPEFEWNPRQPQSGAAA